MPENNASVALVDDEAELVRTYELFFLRRQVPVAFVAYDGKTALEKFRDSNARPVVVLVDYRMPLMSGLELTGDIKKLEPGTKVVFISADESVRQEAIKAGANVFLKKPISLRILIDATRALMGE
jgi:two-component system, chemotaxis family, chemotaxis protein CheY